MSKFFKKIARFFVILFFVILFAPRVAFAQDPALDPGSSSGGGQGAYNPSNPRFTLESACKQSCSGRCDDIGGNWVCVTSSSTGSGQNLFGQIKPPAGITSGPEGLGNLISAVLKLLVIAGGVWALFNFIIAGYQFIQAGGDAKAVAGAWARIWQSVVGIVIIAASFLFAAIIGQMFFGSPTAILSPKLITP